MKQRLFTNQKFVVGKTTKQRIFTFTNQKGGVGKTTVAVEMAQYMARSGHNVLFVDLDAQASATALLKANPNHAGALQFLAGADFDDVAQVTADGITVLAAARELETATYSGDFKNALRDMLQALRQFDTIIIDPPRAGGALQYMAICAATDIIITLMPCVMSNQGAALTLDTMRAAGKKPTAFIISGYKPKNEMSLATLGAVNAAAKSFKGCHVLTIRHSDSVPRAQAIGTPIIEYNGGRTNPARDMITAFNILSK